jgi:hypothetical protein
MRRCTASLLSPTGGDHGSGGARHGEGKLPSIWVAVVVEGVARGDPLVAIRAVVPLSLRGDPFSRVGAPPHPSPHWLHPHARGEWRGGGAGGQQRREAAHDSRWRGVDGSPLPPPLPCLRAPPPPSGAVQRRMDLQEHGAQRVVLKQGGGPLPLSSSATRGQPLEFVACCSTVGERGSSTHPTSSPLPQATG